MGNTVFKIQEGDNASILLFLQFLKENIIGMIY